MRRILGLGLAVGLLAGLLPAAPSMGQEGTISLSFDDGGDTPSAVTGVAEGGGAQTVRVVAEAGTLSRRMELTVTIAAGTATAGADYQVSALSTTVTIERGDSVGYSAPLTVTPVSDTMAEDDETIVFSGTPRVSSVWASGYKIIGADLHIVDDDITLSDDDITLSFDDGGSPPSAVTGVAEGGGAQTVRVVATVARPVSENVVVTVQMRDVGTAADTIDFAVRRRTEVTIASGSTAGYSEPLTVTPVSDALLEGDETIRFFGTAPDYNVVSARLLIFDDDGYNITLSFDDGGSPPSAVTGVAEGGGAQTVRVVATAARPVSGNVAVTVMIGAGTATATTDYAVSASSTTVTISNGDAVGYSEPLTVTPVSDTMAEDDETIWFSGTAPDDRVVGAGLYIVDDDVVTDNNIDITLSLDDGESTPSAVTEFFAQDGEQTVRVVATAAQAVSEDVEVNVNIGAGYWDVSVSPSYTTVTISNGDTVGYSETLTVTPDTSYGFYEDEPIEIDGEAVNTANDYDVIGATFYVFEYDITLSFDDGESTPSAVTGVMEEGGAQTVRVVATAAQAVSGNVAVTVTIGAGTATATTDYTASAASATVTIASGDTVGYSGLLTVTPVSDTSLEGDETIMFSGTAPGDYVFGADLYIVDDDDDITLSFDDGGSPPSAVTGVAEGGGAQMVRVVATAAQAVSSDVTVAVEIGEYRSYDYRRATDTDDYGGLPQSTTVTISNGATVGYSASLTVTPVSDNILEGDETIGFSGEATGYSVLATELRIRDDDIGLSFDDGESSPSEVTGVAEGGGAQTVRVVATAARPVSGNVAVTVAIAAGTATATTDYAVSASSTTVTIASGETVGYSASLTVTPVSDTVWEGEETIVFSGTATGYGIDDAPLYIRDVDLDITLSFDDGESTPSAVTGVMEEGGAQTVRVVATAAQTVQREVVVHVAIAGGERRRRPSRDSEFGTARPDDFTRSRGHPWSQVTTDYGGLPETTTVRIAAGTTVGYSMDLTVTPVSDTDWEGDESIVFSGFKTAVAARYPFGDWQRYDDAELFIVDNEEDEGEITLSFRVRSEDGGRARFVVWEDGGLQTVWVVAKASKPVWDNNVEVTLDLESGENVTTDYELSALSTTVTFESGSMTGFSDTLTITPVSDNFGEGDQKIRFEVTWTSGSVTGLDYYFLSSNDPIRGHIMEEGYTIDLVMIDTIDDYGDILLSLDDGGDPPSAVTCVSTEGGTVRVVATASEPVPDKVVINHQLNSDFFSISSTTVTIAKGETVGYSDLLTVTVEQGSPVEQGLFTYSIGFVDSVPGYFVTGTGFLISESCVTNITLSFDDGGSPPSAVTGVAEGGGAQTVRVVATAARPVSGNVAVTVMIGAGTATATTDYAVSAPSTTVTIASGETVGYSTSLTVTPVDDSFAEGLETIQFTTDFDGVPSGFLVNNWRSLYLSITDDDLDVTLTVDTDRDTLTEFEDNLSEGAATSVWVRAEFASATSNELSSGLEVSVTAEEAFPVSARGEGVDFKVTASPRTVTIPSGRTSSGWTRLDGLRVIDDAVTETAETFLVTGSVSGGTVYSAILTIGASDDVLEVSVFPDTATEGATAHTVTVEAGFANAVSSELTGAKTVNVVVASGDTNGASLATSCPTSTDDACTDKATFNISIPTGQTSASDTFDLTARDENAAESAETLKVTGTIAGTSNSDSDTLFIVDDGIQLEVLDPTDDSDLSMIGEGEGTVSVRVRVTMPASDTSARVVGLNVTGGTATADTDDDWTVQEDYRLSGLTKPMGTPVGHDLGVTVNANETQGTADFTLTIQDDDVDEDDKTIQITGGDVGSLKLIGTSLSITDNDNPPASVALTLSLETTGGEPLVAVREDERNPTVVRVQASYPDDKVHSRTVPIRIMVGKASGEAEPGTDYQTVDAFNVVIDEYKTTGVNRFHLMIGNAEDDQIVEGTETVTITGDATAAGYTGTIGESSFTIIDDDATINLTLLDSSNRPLTTLEEGTTSTTITVQAAYPGSSTASAAHTVRISLEEETASAEDYQATLTDPFDITINAGDNNATGTFTLALDGPRDDDIAEGDETMQITGVLDGFIVNPATLTITDDADQPTGINLTVSPSSVREDRGPSALTVQVTAALMGHRRSQPTPVQVTVGGVGTTATDGRDYRNINPTSFTISIPAETQSATGTFTIVILNDDRDESTERIRISATSDFGNAFGFFNITNVPAPPPSDDGGGAPPPPSGGGGGGGAPPPSGGGGGGAPPPSGGGDGGGALPPAGPATPPPPVEPACQGRFCDEDGSVHQANIEKIAAWQITLGCDANDPTKFCPSAQITRRQMAAFLYRAVSQRWTISTPEGIEISDVPVDAWYRSFADWVVSIEAFAAPNGVFNPGGVVTRADMAVMMIAAFPHVNAVSESEGLFGDVAGADPAVIRAVEGMYHTGVTRGCSAAPLNYCPHQPVTRAQMASFFVRAVELASTSENSDSGS